MPLEPPVTSATQAREPELHDRPRPARGGARDRLRGPGRVTGRPGKHGPGHEPGAAGVVLVEEAAHQLTGRMEALCRWGYLVGHLSEDEAWSFILYAAGRVQGTFDSWEDLGRNYLIGREYWSHDETRAKGHLYREAYLRLLRDPGSPWTQLPWYTDLS